MPLDGYGFLPAFDLIFRVDGYFRQGLQQEIGFPILFQGITYVEGTKLLGKIRQGPKQVCFLQQGIRVKPPGFSYQFLYRHPFFKLIHPRSSYPFSHYLNDVLSSRYGGGEDVDSIPVDQFEVPFLILNLFEINV